MKAAIVVTLKPSVLDPQGDAVKKAIHGLGLPQVQSVRIGKLIELEIADANPETIRPKLEEISRDLLSNPIIENYRIEIRS